MGLLAEGVKASQGRGLFGDFFGPDITTGEDAARLANQGNRNALDELRRQFGITEQSLSPFIQAGQQGLEQFRGVSTPQGLDEQLGQIFGSQNFQNLRDERTRSVEGQLAAGGLTRSGTAVEEIANVPTDLGFEIEQLLAGRSGGLAQSGQQASLGLESFRQGSATNQANILRDIGQQKASGLLTDVQATAERQQQAQDNRLLVGSMFFSDPRLKENVEEIGDIGELKLYQWDWIEPAKNTIVGLCTTMGFMADEVKEKFPEHVYRFCGLDVIDYPKLLNELEGNYANS